MFLYAVSPWSVQFARVAFEANVGVSLVIIGASLFVWGLYSKKPWLLFLGLVPLVMSAYTYHSNKLFSPLLFCPIEELIKTHYCLS